MIIPIFTWEDILSRTGGDRAIILTEQQQYIFQQLLSFVQQNTEQSFPDVANYDIADIDLAIWQTMNALMADDVVSQWQQSIYYFPIEGYSSKTGTLTWTSSAAQGNAGWWELSNAVNNYLQYDNVAVKQGSYIFRLFGYTSNVMGTANLFLNGTSAGVGIDMYSSVGANNILKQSSGFNVPADDVYQVQLKMSTKNASSSGYLLRANWFQLVRTGD